MKSQSIFVIKNKGTGLFWMVNPMGSEFRWTGKLTMAIQFSDRDKAVEILSGNGDIFEIVEFKCTPVSKQLVLQS